MSQPTVNTNRRQHVLPASPATVHWRYLDAALPDVLEIESGDAVSIATVSGGYARLPADGRRFEVLSDHRHILERCRSQLGPHILTGPIHVRGALPGDVLRVSVDRVDLRQNWGWNEIAPGCGLLAYLEPEAETLTIPINIQTGCIDLPCGGHTAAKPFLGVMAVKPAAALGRITSSIPGPFGGNLDVRHLGPGAEIYFPVFAAGAGFSAGDGHALQGDGEIDGSAVETALTGLFTLTIVRDLEALAFPFALIEGKLLTLAVHEDLDQVLANAVDSAVRLLSARFGMSARRLSTLQHSRTRRRIAGCQCAQGHSLPCACSSGLLS